MTPEESFPQDDKDFLKGLDAKAEGTYPGMEQRLEDLRFQGLGRAILIEGETKEKKLQSAITERLVTGQESDVDLEEEQGKYIGHILPLNLDESKHLIILNNGSILVVERPDSYKDYYNHEFMSSESPLALLSSHKNASHWEANHFGFGSLIKTLLSNKNQKDLEGIKSSISEAMGVAKEVKAKKDASVKASVDALFLGIDGLLGKQAAPAAETSSVSDEAPRSEPEVPRF